MSKHELEAITMEMLEEFPGSHKVKMWVSRLLILDSKRLALTSPSAETRKPGIVTATDRKGNVLSKIDVAQVTDDRTSKSNENKN